MRKDEAIYYINMLDNLFDLVVSGDSKIDTDRQMNYVVKIKKLKDMIEEELKND